MENIDFSKIKFESGFWKYRYDLNKKVTLKHVYEQFEKSGRFDSLRFRYKEGGSMPHIYHDSDVAKWMEAVAYLIAAEGGYQEEQLVIDSLVIDMEKNQLDNGYLNSYYIQIEPDKIFENRNAHELYCAGHLIEAAIAYDKATGKSKFLKLMLKYVDFIEQAFITEKTAKFSTPGHEEIELALIKLYEHTRDKKYLDMAKFFIDGRGVLEEPWESLSFNLKQIQSEMPVRELILAEGHAVRATYLYTGMAELARKENDKELLDACKRVYEDIVNKKMYVTGGIGSAPSSEGFTVSYDLPNLEGYSESCAAIGFILFAHAMQKNEFSVQYAHLIERIMYNGLLSSTSIDGKAFFYENSLEIHLESIGKETSRLPNKRIHFAKPQRSEVFSCSCCPPNINRIFARLGDLFFLEKENDLVINQFGALTLVNDKIKLKMTTDYPNDGKICIKIADNTYGKIYVRIPEWCDHYSVSVNYNVENGYIVLSNSENLVEIDFKMHPYFVESNPNVRSNAGRVALCYGPTVYCLERIDNHYPLNALSVDVKKEIQVGNVCDYHMRNLVSFGKVDENFNGLYRKAKDSAMETELYFRPYWTFANREKSDMLVWIRKA